MGVSGSSHRRWVGLGAVAVTIICISIGWIAASRGSPTTVANTTLTTRLVPIVITDLIVRQLVTGKVGVAATSTIRAAAGSTPAEVEAARDALAAARDQLLAARASSAAATLSSKATIAHDTAQLSTAKGSGVPEAIKVAKTMLAIDKAQATAQSRQNEANTRAADRAVKAAERALAVALDTETFGGGTITEVPPVGATVDRGEALLHVDGRPIALLFGSSPTFRPLRLGMVGNDVRLLQENLLAIGEGPTPGFSAIGHFDAATAVAVKNWQHRLGVPQTGEILYGEVLFLPGPTTITAATAQPGDPYTPATPILDVAIGGPIVTIALDPSLQTSISVGDQVEMTLPTGRSVAGTITSIADVATAGGQGEDPGGPLAIGVIVAPDDPKSLAHLDQASVSAAITTGRADRVMAVPIDALVALAGGGYAVEVDRAGIRDYVQVSLGTFAESLVEVRGAGLTEGIQVVVPGGPGG